MEGTEKNQIICPFIVTGATGSMGSVAVRKLVSDGVPVIMASRNLQKGEILLNNIKEEFPDAQLELAALDLDSAKSVREFVSALSTRKISGIFNNAGVISREWSITEDGVEHTMAVNFVNPALLTTLLTPNFIQGARIVNMVSLTTRFASIGKDWNKTTSKEFNRLKVYANSKLAFLLFSIAFARKHPELVVNVADPGVVNSNMLTMGKWYDPLADIIFRPFTNSPEKGAAPALRAINAEKSLEYYVGKKNNTISSKYTDHPMVEELWNYITSLKDDN